MHKDPPPTLLERSFTEIVLHGLVVGFVASLIFFGAWALFSADRQNPTLPSRPVPTPASR